jgi:hypothetical protein
MKIDFELLDQLVAAGATGSVIVTLLKKQHLRGEAKRIRDREGKKAERHVATALIVAPKKKPAAKAPAPPTTTMPTSSSRSPTSPPSTA